MQLDDLKHTWKKEIKMSENIIDFEQTRKTLDKFNSQSNVAWMLELAACASVGIFIIAIWLMGPPLETLTLPYKLGMLSMLACSLFIGAKIIAARKVSTNDDWTLQSRLNIQIEKREKEAKLLANIASWYLCPIFFSILIVSYGKHTQKSGSYIPDASLLLYWTVCIGLAVGIFLYNKHNLNTKVRPTLDKLYALRSQLQDDKLS